jgi:hypothetical protein
VNWNFLVGRDPAGWLSEVVVSSERDTQVGVIINSNRLGHVSLFRGGAGALPRWDNIRFVPQRDGEVTLRIWLDAQSH